jgi:hypothetical protein
VVMSAVAAAAAVAGDADVVAAAEVGQTPWTDDNLTETELCVSIARRKETQVQNVTN